MVIIGAVSQIFFAGFAMLRCALFIALRSFTWHHFAMMQFRYMSLNTLPNQSSGQTAVGAFSSAVSVRVACPAWITR